MERYVKIFKKIDDIKDIWDSLYSGGTDMTPYQSFEWNKNVAECYKSNTYIFLNLTVRYFVCFKDQQPLVIAPLALPKNKYNESCYTQILGQYTKSGGLNFIYGNEASGEDFRFLIEYIKNVYPNEMRFYEVGDYTRFNEFLSEYEEAEKISDRVCVRCAVPESKEDNYGALSKSVRQTIRTTYNRFEKEGIISNVEIYRGYNFGGMELKELNDLYNRREAEWHHREYVAPNGNSINPLKKIVGKVFKNKDALINYSHSDKFIFVKCMIDGKLAGFFYGVSDASGYCIVPTLAINSDYSKYSPGLLMIYGFINDGIENENLSIFDLSRGDETYKSRYIPNPVKYMNNDYKIEAERSFLTDVIEREVK